MLPFVTFILSQNPWNLHACIQTLINATFLTIFTSFHHNLTIISFPANILFSSSILNWSSKKSPTTKASCSSIVNMFGCGSPTNSTFFSLWQEWISWILVWTRGWKAFWIVFQIIGIISLDRILCFKFSLNPLRFSPMRETNTKMLAPKSEQFSKL